MLVGERVDNLGTPPYRLGVNRVHVPYFYRDLRDYP